MTFVITLDHRWTLYDHREEFGPVPADVLKTGMGAVLAPLPIGSGVTTIILDGDVPTALGLPDVAPKDDPVTDHPFLLSIRQGGWEVSELAPWMRCTKGKEGEDGELLICVRRWVHPTDCPLLHPDRRRTAYNLVDWYMSTGVAWWGTGGIVGSNLLRRDSMHRTPTGRPGVRPGIRWHLETPRGRPEWSTAETPYHPKRWSEERPGAYQYKVDAYANYLAAAQSVLLAGSQLRKGPTEFDPKLSGMWLIETERWGHIEELPDPAGYAHGSALRRWVATPTLRLLDDLQRADRHGGYVIVRSEVNHGTQIMRPWATHLRNLLLDFPKGGQQPEMRAAVGETYKRMMGMMARPGGRVYRPDWTAQIVSHARSNIWRKASDAAKGGFLPVHFKTDEVTYRGDSPDLPPVLSAVYPEGDALGLWHHKVVPPTEEQG